MNLDAYQTVMAQLSTARQLHTRAAMARPLPETTMLTTLAACGWLAITACSGTSDSSQDSGIVAVGGATIVSGGSTASAGRSGVGGTSAIGGSIGTGGSKAAGGTLGTGGVTQVASCP